MRSRFASYTLALLFANFAVAGKNPKPPREDPCVPPMRALLESPIIWSERAKKDLKGIDNSLKRIKDRAYEWAKAVERDGLAQASRSSGLHDEPLHGDRQGQRSVRLNQQYRLIYRMVSPSGKIEILEITPHKY